MAAILALCGGSLVKIWPLVENCHFTYCERLLLIAFSLFFSDVYFQHCQQQITGLSLALILVCDSHFFPDPRGSCSLS